MNFELEELANNGTWKLVYLSLNVKPIRIKWFYKIKHKDDGSIKKCKASFVAKEYSQFRGWILLHFGTRMKILNRGDDGSQPSMQ